MVTFVFFIPAVIIRICSIKRLANFNKRVCDAFNKKYKKQRGVTLSAQGDLYVCIEVNHPGECINGVKTFPLSRDNFLLVQHFLRGVRPFPEVDIAIAPVMTALPSEHVMQNATTTTTSSTATTTTTTTTTPTTTTESSAVITDVFQIQS